MLYMPIYYGLNENNWYIGCSKKREKKKDRKKERKKKWFRIMNWDNNND